MKTEEKKPLPERSDEIRLALIDRTLNYTNATISSAFTIHAIHDQRLDLGTIAKELTQSAGRLVEGNTREIEMTLLSQAQTLDVLFHRMLTQLSAMQMINQIHVIADIALRAQNQSRKTLAVLADLKNPRRATFIKQQNNAVNQQVNNTTNQNNSEISEKLANELVSEVKDEKMDDGRKTKAIPANTQSEAMVTLHRPADRARKIKK